MALVDRMSRVYNRVYGISDRLGVPTHIDFTYKNRMTGVVTNIIPRPQIGNPPAYKMTQWREQGNVEVSSNDKYVTGVSRTFDGITEGAVCQVNGRDHTILWIDKEQAVTYNLLVRPERAR